jgi:hypothetical protein
MESPEQAVVPFNAVITATGVVSIVIAIVFDVALPQEFVTTQV